MAMVDIASQIKGAKPVSLYEISARTNIKLNYLEQIFLKLKKNKLVGALKGPGGGYFLSKPSSEIKIIDIVHAVNESIKMTRCHDNNVGCAPKGAHCLTHYLWYGLSKHIFNYLDSITLEDVCLKKVEKDYVS